MQTGFAAVEAALKEAAARSSSGGGYLKNLFWKDGEKKIVRFLTDEVVTCRIYEYVHCKDGTGRDFVNNASLQDGAQDWVAMFNGQAYPYGSKTLAPAEDRKMTYGIVALREEIPREAQDGARNLDIGYQDVLEEVIVEDDKGNKETFGGRYFAVIKAAHQNFWDPLIGYFLRYKTICDRDYEITRRGGDKGTGYTIIPCTAGPDPDLPSEEAVQKFYGYGTKQSPTDPNRFLYCPQTLVEWVEDNASEGRARHWLLGETQQAPLNGAGSTTTTTTGSSPTPATGSQTPASNSTQNAPSQASDGANEFHKDTTQNPEEKANAKPSPSPSTETKFAGLRDAIRANK